MRITSIFLGARCQLTEPYCLEVSLQREIQGPSPVIVTSEGKEAGREIEERIQCIGKGLLTVVNC